METSHISLKVAGARRGTGTRPGRMDWRRAGGRFVVLHALLVAVVIGVPLMRLTWLAFSDYDGLSSPVWAGLDNFKFLLSWEPLHQIVKFNLLLVVVGIPLWTVVPFLIAVATFGRRSAPLVRALLFVPALIPPVVIGTMFRALLRQDGVVNAVLGVVVSSPPAWLSDERLVPFAVIGVIAWSLTGAGVLFYAAGLSALPASMIDAAKVDGANAWQMIWHIYRPALRPVTEFWILIQIINTVTAFFPWIASLTLGGPGYASTTLDYAVYSEGLAKGDFGLGSALAVTCAFYIVALFGAWYALRRVRAAVAGS